MAASLGLDMTHIHVCVDYVRVPASQGHCEALHALLQVAPAASVLARDGESGWTPFHRAMYNGHAPGASWRVDGDVCVHTRKFWPLELVHDARFRFSVTAVAGECQCKKQGTSSAPHAIPG